MKRLFYFLLAIFTISVIQSCITDDYNLSKDLDGSICFAPGGFTLGGDNSADVPLSEIIELSDSGQLTTDAEGNYLFYKRGDDMEPTTIIIGQGSLCDAYNMERTMRFKTDASASEVKRYPEYSNVTFTENVDLECKPDTQNASIRELIYIATPMTITIQTKFNGNITSFCNSMTLTYSLPSFFDVADKSELTQTIKMDAFDKLTEHVIHLKGVDFTKSNKSAGEAIGIDHETNAIFMKGKVSVTGKTTVETEKYNSALTSNPAINFYINVGTMGTNLVTGRFDKKEDIDLDPITLDDLPEFIRDEEVVVDVENPVVRVTLDNEVPADVTLDANLKSFRNGECVAQVNVGSEYGTTPILFRGATDTEPSRRTNVWISRIPTTIPDSVQTNVVLTDMMNLIRQVPDRVDIVASAHTDSTKIVTLALGKEYTASPFYELVAPLKIGPKMKIVYSKTMDELHDRLKDMELSGFEFSGDITNNIPLDLHVKATPLDENGNIISDIIINTTDTIPANSKKTVTFSMENNDAKAIQRIYTIEMKAYAESNEGLAGQYLNKNQNLRIEHAKITLKGAKYDLNGK